ncbi:MAG: integrase [Hyphomicrobiales bacterium]|nr:MAG: integrase [Hyphomicrobiales bacterium]
MPKLTKRTVDAAKASDAEFIVWDDEIPGFGLRVYPSGRKAFIFQYRTSGGRRGRVRKVTIGTYGALTPDHARQQAKELSANAARGDDPAAAKREQREAPRMSDLFVRYLSEHATVYKKASSVTEDARLIKLHLLPAFSTRRVRDVSRDEIIKLHRSLHATPYVANRCVALLSKAFNLAELWGWRADGSNPCRHVRKYREVARERVLSPDEIERLGRALAQSEKDGANPHAILAIRIAALTGWRIGEVRNLTWEQVDFEQRVAHLVDTKTGDRTAPLSAAALEFLANSPRMGSHVIPGRSGDNPLDYKAILKVWRRACETAGLKNTRLHDLRHTAATMAASFGANALLVRDLLGHRTLAMSNRYVSRMIDPVRDLSDRVASSIDRTMRGAGTADVVPLDKAGRH